MTAGPLPATLWISPTQANVGGTQVRGIFEDAITWDDGVGAAHFGGGLESDNWTTIRRPDATPPKLIIPIRNVNAQSLTLLFSLLSAGSNVVSHGSPSTAVHGNPPAVALALRPKDTTQLFLYGPRWTLHADSVKRLTWHRNRAHYDGAELALAPSRSLDHTLRAFMFDTAANIDTYYGLGGA